MDSLVKDVINYDIERRTLLKHVGLTGIAAGVSLPFSVRAKTNTAPEEQAEKVVWSMCSVNCGSRCALRMHVKQDEVVWVETGRETGRGQI